MSAAWVSAEEVVVVGRSVSSYQADLGFQHGVGLFSCAALSCLGLVVARCLRYRGRRPTGLQEEKEANLEVEVTPIIT